jgi:hypothetical protein
MSVTEVRFHDTVDATLTVSFTAIPPFPDGRVLRSILSALEADVLRRWRYDIESGQGRYELTEDYSLWGEGGRMWIDTDTAVIHFQAAPGQERIEAGVRLRPDGVVVG